MPATLSVPDSESRSRPSPTSSSTGSTSLICSRQSTTRRWPVRVLRSICSLRESDNSERSSPPPPETQARSGHLSRSPCQTAPPRKARHGRPRRSRLPLVSQRAWQRKRSSRGCASMRTIAQYRQLPAANVSGTPLSGLRSTASSFGISTALSRLRASWSCWTSSTQKVCRGFQRSELRECKLTTDGCVTSRQEGLLAFFCSRLRRSVREALWLPPRARSSYR